jgi:hypothetical protein
VISPLNAALQGVPSRIREKLVASYVELKRNLSESRADAAGLSVGKLCESVLRLLQHRALGGYTPFGKKIPNFPDECRKIIASTPVQPITDSEKLVIPRALAFLYTMRNTRGIGHIGGDVDPNAVDAEVMGSVADWIVCELIRIHHGLSLEEAQDLVDSLASRRIPDIWEVSGKKRVLREGLPARDQALLLLYSTRDSAVLTEDLIAWVEYSNPAVFRSRVLAQLHKDRFVEWDRYSETVTLSPKGVRDVEQRLLASSSAVPTKTAGGRSRARA